MRHTTVLLTAACLALAGCSGGSEPEKETVTVTASPSLSEAEARAACVDAWLVVLKDTPDAAPDGSDKPAVCDGLSGQATMYAEALQARNQANRDKIAECREDPTCTSVKVP